MTKKQADELVKKDCAYLATPEGREEILRQVRISVWDSVWDQVFRVVDTEMDK